MAKKPKKDAEMDKLMEGDAPTDAAPATEAEAPAPDAGPMLSVLAQYMKDCSFENPGAPDSLRSGQAQPNVNIDLRIARQVFENNTVEVSILLKASAERDGKGVFIAELEYAGLFAIANVGLEQMQPLMMIECPRIL
ncbi:MAG: protein-export chaperone SecB, partial [Pseudomonadota bacterium]